MSGQITLEEKRAALEFERGVWQRWAKHEITTDEVAAELERYVRELLERVAARK